MFKYILEVVEFGIDVKFFILFSLGVFFEGDDDLTIGVSWFWGRKSSFSCGIVFCVSLFFEVFGTCIFVILLRKVGIYDILKLGV